MFAKLFKESLCLSSNQFVVKDLFSLLRLAFWISWPLSPNLQYEGVRSVLLYPSSSWALKFQQYLENILINISQYYNYLCIKWSIEKVKKNHNNLLLSQEILCIIIWMANKTPIFRPSDFVYPSYDLRQNWFYYYKYIIYNS